MYISLFALAFNPRALGSAPFSCAHWLNHISIARTSLQNLDRVQNSRAEVRQTASEQLKD
jgi:hypothetical protein